MKIFSKAALQPSIANTHALVTINQQVLETILYNHNLTIIKVFGTCSVFAETKSNSPILYDEESGNTFEETQMSSQLYRFLSKQKLLPQPDQSDFDGTESYDTKTYKG